MCNFVGYPLFIFAYRKWIQHFSTESCLQKAVVAKVPLMETPRDLFWIYAIIGTLWSKSLKLNRKTLGDTNQLIEFFLAQLMSNAKKSINRFISSNKTNGPTCINLTHGPMKSLKQKHLTDYWSCQFHKSLFCHE